MRANPSGISWVHNCFTGGSDGNFLRKFRISGLSNPSDLSLSSYFCVDENR